MTTSAPDTTNIDPMTALTNTEPPQDAAVTPPPAPPTADTSFDVSDLFEPGLKKGTHRVLARIIGFESYRTQEGATVGWQFTIVTLAKLEDAVGGSIDEGKRYSYLNLYTTAGQFGTAIDAAKKVKRAILALNNIDVNMRDKASVAAAQSTIASLPPERLLPTAVDEDLSHYDQWKETVVVAVIKADEKDGETKVKLVALEAASTAA